MNENNTYNKPLLLKPEVYNENVLKENSQILNYAKTPSNTIKAEIKDLSNIEKTNDELFKKLIPDDGKYNIPSENIGKPRKYQKSLNHIEEVIEKTSLGTPINNPKGTLTKIKYKDESRRKFSTPVERGNSTLTHANISNFIQSGIKKDIEKRNTRSKSLQWSNMNSNKPVLLQQYKHNMEKTTS